MNTMPQTSSSLVGGVEVNDIVFVYTRRCNLACRHCFWECSATSGPRLDPEIVRQRLSEASDLGIGSVSFTGGECLLHFDEILALVKHAHAQGQKTSVTTNGTWATSDAEAAAKLGQLKDAGLDALRLSYGTFHAEAGARIERVKHIVLEAQTVGLELEVRRIRRFPNDDDDREITRELHDLKCKVTILPVVRFGSARNLGDEVRFIRAPLCEQPRCSNIGYLTYMENGDLFPCCGPVLYELRKVDPPGFLKLGNLYANTLKESLQAARHNLFLTLLLVTGPNGFRILAEESQDGIMWPQELSNICDFCLWAAQNNKFTEWLSSVSQDNIVPRLRSYQEIMERWGLVPREVHL